MRRKCTRKELRLTVTVARIAQGEGRRARGSRPADRGGSSMAGENHGAMTMRMSSGCHSRRSCLSGGFSSVVSVSPHARS